MSILTTTITDKKILSSFKHINQSIYAFAQSVEKVDGGNGDRGSHRAREYEHS